LIVKLVIYFAVLLSGIIVLATAYPEFARVMPIGGTDAIQVASLQIDAEGIRFDEVSDGGVAELLDHSQELPAATIGLIAVYLCLSLASTILVMTPITWTYMATKREVGYPRNFVRTLIVLPICATTIVLLIQDSLALAFGLAAMVAAVRFRVTLTEAIDGIYIFSAICVGLAAGIGYLGIGTIMAMFFCLANAILWQMDYGQNPLDDARREKKRTTQS
jgi:hypothetical protein